MPATEPQRHVVVFDCNVYLDVGRLLGPAFSWSKFDAAAAGAAKDPVPHPTDRAYDSLRAIAMCTSGRFAGDEVLEVWTNAHIEATVRSKAMESSSPDPVTGYRGLGWEPADAQSLVDVLVGDLIERSAGGTLGGHRPDGNPPLDHEDGMVYGACRELSQDDLVANVYCVTRDRGFLRAFHDKRLASHTRVINPSMFVQIGRAARRQLSIRSLAPRI